MPSGGRVWGWEAKRGRCEADAEAGCRARRAAGWGCARAGGSEHGEAGGPGQLVGCAAGCPRLGGAGMEPQY